MMNKETEETTVFDTEKEEGVEYLQPSYIETVLSKDKKKECRDIVRAINDYRVSQRQKMFIIYLLALELEDVALMREITAAVGKGQGKVQDSKIVVEDKKASKILLR